MIENFLLGKWLKHPLHPVLVHLPVGLWSASIMFDVAYLFSRNPDLASASYYSIFIGLLGAFFAVIAGFAEFANIKPGTEAKRKTMTHMILNLIVTVFFIVSYLMRKEMLAQGTIPTASIVISAIAFVLLSISGYIGGDLAYNYGLGSRRDRESTFKNNKENRKAA